MLTLDSDPVLNPVNIGAELLSYMARKEYSVFDIEDLYQMAVDKFSVSYDVFAYTLDWLYLVGAIEMMGGGGISYAPK